MNFNLEQINPKEYEGNVVFLYGSEVADRSLPLSKKELEWLKARREAEPSGIVVFDRIPYHIYFVNFDSEKPANLCQENLRRTAGTLV